MNKKRYLWYCPKCGSLEYKDTPPKKVSQNIASVPIGYQTRVCLRDGYGIPFPHYQCVCGNSLAGCIDLKTYSIKWNESIEQIIQSSEFYFKHVIEMYNQEELYE